MDTIHVCSMYQPRPRSENEHPGVLPLSVLEVCFEHQRLDPLAHDIISVSLQKGVSGGKVTT